MSRPSDSLREVCRATIQKHRMLAEGDSVVVGVSGGADSVALLHVLRELSPEMGFRVSAAHLNHNLRGAESDRDEAFVRELCGRWGIPLTVASAEIAELARRRKRSLEECAREERYAFFRRAAGEKKIATAHTLDDNAETVLLHLTRGAALRGLCGIPPVRDGIIRPLLDCTRAMVEEYCVFGGLSFVNDATNAEERYTRNKLRHRVMPVLREVNPAFLRSVAGTVEALRADADYLDQLAEAGYQGVLRDSHRMDAAALAALPKPLAMRVLARWLAAHGVPVERVRLERVAGLLQSGGAVQLSGDWYCRLRGRELVFLPARRPVVAQTEGFVLKKPVREQNIQMFSDKKLHIRVMEANKFEETINNQKNQFKNELDYDKIDKIVEFRRRLPGDRIRLAGRGCTKTLKKLYNEAGMSCSQRERNLVLANDSGLLWVEGFGVAEGLEPRTGTGRVLVIEVWDESPEGTGN